MDCRFSERQYSAEDAAWIIERATKLEAESTAISVTELREIAAEAGIDGRALEEALRQEADRAVDGALIHGLFGGASLRTSALLAGGFSFAIGAITAVLWENVAGHPIEWAGLAAIILTDLVFALHSAKRRAPVRFQFLSFSLWSGFVLGYGLMIPSLAGDVAAVGGGSALLSAALGGLFINSASPPRGWLHRLGRSFLDRRLVPEVPPSA